MSASRAASRIALLGVALLIALQAARLVRADAVSVSRIIPL